MQMKITPSLLWMLPLSGLIGCADGVDYTSRTAPIGACGPVETHVVGIYDSKGEVVEIKLDRPGKHNLVVSAHAGTKWRISTTNGA
ncbi:MAG: hypothetical protein NT062_04615, partial [Proteobacteria bacterium]|nr:hypothetical protein [Pseudomonadota bacterium]